MNLSLCGINYKSASLEQREPLQINRQELATAVNECLKIDGIIEAAIITTCNRVEFYLVLDDSLQVFDAVQSFYKKWRGIDIGNLRTSFYTFQGSSTARQLYKVTSGADSMVIGETQIQGQVKEAYRIACSVKGPGKILHKLFHIAFRAGKKIRSETEICKGPTSVSGAALEMLSKYINGDKSYEILCIGISPMTEIAITQLLSKGLKNITIANRTFYKAEKTATRFGINCIPLDKLPEALKNTRVVLSATGSDKYILNSAEHGESLKSKEVNETFMIDLAVPRDIDPELKTIPGVKLFDLEDIKYHIEHNRTNREKALTDAETIGETFVGEFMAWQKNSIVEPLIKELREEMERIRLKELDESKRKVPVEQWDELEKLSKALLNKLVDLPVRQLKDMNESSNLPDDPIKLFRELFRLHASSDSVN
ncbi:MAG: glutamyl-tRNA reductase [candidate division Zixibacteria bacterium]|nr:glutamyl-tRNA reductase [candidate division Zixibacteria bacterium]